MTDLQVKAMFLSIITIEITEKSFLSAFSFVANENSKILNNLAVIFTDQMLQHINFISLFAFANLTLSTSKMKLVVSVTQTDPF